MSASGKRPLSWLWRRLLTSLGWHDRVATANPAQGPGSMASIDGPLIAANSPRPIVIQTPVELPAIAFCEPVTATAEAAADGQRVEPRPYSRVGIAGRLAVTSVINQPKSRAKKPRKTSSPAGKQIPKRTASVVKSRPSTSRSKPFTSRQQTASRIVQPTAEIIDLATERRHSRANRLHRAA